MNMEVRHMSDMKNMKEDRHEMKSEMKEKIKALKKK
jgi:hypothetical protein